MQGKTILGSNPSAVYNDCTTEIVKFREYFESKSKEGVSTLDTFPEEHLPLLAKLVQERYDSILPWHAIIPNEKCRSEKTSYVLSKHVHEALKPLSEESSTSGADAPVTFSTVFPQAIIEVAIVALGDRVNYGLDGPGKIPAALCLWRWEVKEKYRGWLPASVQDKLQARRVERQQVSNGVAISIRCRVQFFFQAKEDLRRIFDTLPAAEQETLLKINKQQKGENTGFITFSLNRAASDENMPVSGAQETDASTINVNVSPLLI